MASLGVLVACRRASTTTEQGLGYRFGFLTDSAKWPRLAVFMACVFFALDVNKWRFLIPRPPNFHECCSVTLTSLTSFRRQGRKHAHNDVIRCETSLASGAGKCF